MKKDVVNIIFGDSIAYGYGDNEYFGWHNRLRKKSLKFQKQIFFNLSIPGQSSVEIVKRFKKEFLFRFNNDDVFNIIFAFGINDAAKLSQEKQSIKVFEKNVEKLITLAKKYTNNIYFLGLMNVNVKIKTNYNEKCIKIVDNAIKAICLKKDIKYIKMSEIVHLDELFDGIHPNEKGYQKICNHLYKYLK